MYWAEALAEQTKDPELQTRFTNLAKQLAENEEKITEELLAAQGKSVELGGYYKPNVDLATKAMRPSQTLNAAIESLAIVNA
jgi:isocitrate dehydrogenase